VICRKHTPRLVVRQYRYSRELRETPQFVASIRIDDASACQDDRTLGFDEEVKRSLNGLGSWSRTIYG
jgi:hypothetical protein